MEITKNLSMRGNGSTSFPLTLGDENDARLIDNSHPETPAIVPVVVVVHRQNQPSISRRIECALAADEERLRHAAIAHADVTDERAEGCVRCWVISIVRVISEVSFRRDGSCS